MIETVVAEARVPAGVQQAFKFLAVGVLNTALDVGLYFAFTHWLGVWGVWKVTAKAVSYGVGVLNSFAWNRSWTFRSEASAMSTLAPFVLVNLMALGINAGAMHVCLGVFSLPELLSLALATGVGFLWNFTISKFFIFKK